jgi:hypothetical protein
MRRFLQDIRLAGMSVKSTKFIILAARAFRATFDAQKLNYRISIHFTRGNSIVIDVRRRTYKAFTKHKVRGTSGPFNSGLDDVKTSECEVLHGDVKDDHQKG